MWLKVDTADNHVTQTEADTVLHVRTIKLWGFCFKDQVLISCLFFCVFFLSSTFIFPIILFYMFWASSFQFPIFSLFFLCELFFFFQNLKSKAYSSVELTLMKVYLLGQTQWAKAHVLGSTCGEKLPRQHDNIRCFLKLIVT